MLSHERVQDLAVAHTRLCWGSEWVPVRAFYTPALDGTFFWVMKANGKQDYLDGPTPLFVHKATGSCLVISNAALSAAIKEAAGDNPAAFIPLLDRMPETEAERAQYSAFVAACVAHTRLPAARA